MGVRTNIKDVESLVETAGEVVDNLTTTSEEEKDFLYSVHSADMKSDSWLSKNVRPLFLVVFTVAFFLQGMEVLQLSERMEIIMGDIFMTTVMFYFGGRSIEKFERTRQKGRVIDGKISRRDKRLEKRLNK